MNVVPSLTLVRRFRAPPQRIFEAWTRPNLMALWFGPHHTRVEEAEVDARPGGRFRIGLVEDNGARHEVGGTYDTVDPGKRLVFTWAWQSMPERESRVTVDFREVLDGTEVTLTHDRFADPATATRHTRGWTEALERLARHIQQPGEQDR